MDCQLYITNVPVTATEEQLAAHFEKLGFPASEIWIRRDTRNLLATYAFVKYAHGDQVLLARAAAAADKSVFGVRRIRASKSLPPKPKTQQTAQVQPEHQTPAQPPPTIPQP